MKKINSVCPPEELQDTGISGGNAGEDLPAEEKEKTKQRHKAFFSTGQEQRNLSRDIHG